MNNGSCLCGDIQWQSTGPVTMAVNCHCSMCRKAHGSPYASFAVVASSDFEWLTGKDRIRTYASSAEGSRPFCPRCGSIVPMTMGELAFMPTGNMEKTIDRPLDSHIFTASKAPWFEISDGATQFEAYPPGVDRPPVELGPREPETPGAVSGSCLCGSVRYEFDGPADRMLYCHCSRCRKSRSALHSAQVFVAADRFRWLAGSDLVDKFKVPDAKAFTPSFCRDCGSKVPRVIEEANLAVVPAGSLDQDPGIRAEAHIFTASCSPSYTFTDDLPRFDEYPPR